MASTKQRRRSREFWDTIHKIQAENNNCSTSVAREIYKARTASNGSQELPTAPQIDPTTWSVDHLLQVAKTASERLGEQIAEHQRQITALNDAKGHWDTILAETQPGKAAKPQRARQPEHAAH
jgi:hypothetical protein